MRRTGGNLTGPGVVRVRLYLSTNTSFDSSDYRASLDYSGSQFSTSTLNSSGIETRNVECAPGDISIPPTLPFGTYYWIAVVDYDNQHYESSESNNVLVGGLATVR